MKRNLGSVLFTILSAVTLAACAVPGPSGPAANAGTVEMWVTDAPRSDNVTEIWVTVSEVKIHKAGTGNVSANTSGNISDNTSGNVSSNSSEGQVDDTADTGGWITVNLTGPNRFDLLTLRGDGNGTGLQQILAAANLSAGRYTQVRMTIAKVEVKISGVLKDATLPSGKLKFVHPFDVEAGNVTKLLFDFDADKFVTVTGNPNDPKIMVKPVVKLTSYRPEHPDKAQRGNNKTAGNPGNGQANDPAGANITADRNQRGVKANQTAANTTGKSANPGANAR